MSTRMSRLAFQRNITRRASATGVTLVEMVIVLMVLGILTAAAAPKFFDSLARYRAEAAANRIAYDLRLARRHAEATSASQSVVFNSPAAHQYEMPGMDDPQRGGQTYAVNLAGEPFLAIIVSASFNGDATIIFDGYGMPDSGGSVTVQVGTHQKTVTVDANSGKVDVS